MTEPTSPRDAIRAILWAHFPKAITRQIDSPAADLEALAERLVGEARQAERDQFRAMIEAQRVRRPHVSAVASQKAAWDLGDAPLRRLLAMLGGSAGSSDA